MATVPRINRARRVERFLGALSRPTILRRLCATLSKAPILGPPLQRLVRRFFPGETRVWFRISAGCGKGLWVNLNPRFEMDYASGNYETRIEQALSLYLQQGSIFYDVGAHIGVFSMIAARNVGPQGLVYAFEPDPWNSKRIEEHASRNRLDSIRIIPKAASSSVGRQHFQRASLQSSMNRGVLATDASAVEGSTIEVDTITLDAVAREYALPSLIKIDVEGSEAAVLQGSEEIFRSAKPVLVCEIHHQQASTEVTHWLQARGYTLEWLESSTEFPRHLFAKYVG